MDDDGKVVLSRIHAVVETQQTLILQLEHQLRESSEEMNRLKRAAMGLSSAHQFPPVTHPVIQRRKRMRGTAQVPASSLSAVSLAVADKVATRTQRATTRYWTTAEHGHFLIASKKFGRKNYAAISQFVGTRNPKQVRTHAQKYEMRLARENTRRVLGNPHRSSWDDCKAMSTDIDNLDVNLLADLASGTESVPDMAETAEVSKGGVTTRVKPSCISPLAVHALGYANYDIFSDPSQPLEVDDIMLVPNQKGNDGSDAVAIENDDLDWLANIAEGQFRA